MTCDPAMYLVAIPVLAAVLFGLASLTWELARLRHARRMYVQMIDKLSKQFADIPFSDGREGR